MLWWEMESWPTKMWGIGEKRLRTPVLDHVGLIEDSKRLGGLSMGPHRPSLAWNAVVVDTFPLCH